MQESVVKIKQWLNETEMVLAHGQNSRKWQFNIWSFFIKTAFCIFIYTYVMQNNWQLHYLRTLLIEYQKKSTVVKVKQNCVFAGYEDESMSLVQFYFAGTRGFKINYDGTMSFSSDAGYEDGFGVEVGDIGPFLVDGWDSSDLHGVQDICLHYVVVDEQDQDEEQEEMEDFLDENFLDEPLLTTQDDQTYPQEPVSKEQFLEELSLEEQLLEQLSQKFLEELSLDGQFLEELFREEQLLEQQYLEQLPLEQLSSEEKLLEELSQKFLDELSLDGQLLEELFLEELDFLDNLEDSIASADQEFLQFDDIQYKLSQENEQDEPIYFNNNQLRYDPRTNQFIYLQNDNSTAAAAAAEAINNIVVMKDVFGSAAKFPCLPRYMHIIPDFEVDEYATFSIIQPEPDCKRMFDYFEQAGLPSYMQPIPGFELPYEAILRSSSVYEKLAQSIGENTTKAEMDVLIWGDETPKRTYRLYQVNEFENECSEEQMDSLIVQLDHINDLYEQVSWSMPMTYLLLLFIFEYYLLNYVKSVYLCNLALCYIYILFLNNVFYRTINDEIQGLDTNQWSCINKQWWHQVGQFPIMVAAIQQKLFLLVISAICVHVALVLLFLSQQMQLRMPEMYKRLLKLCLIAFLSINFVMLALNYFEVHDYLTYVGVLNNTHIDELFISSFESQNNSTSTATTTTTTQEEL